MKKLLIIFISMISCACSMFGWQYQYDGRNYTMNRKNINYHEAAVRDIDSQDSSAKKCELSKRYIADAPKGGHWTSASELLERDMRGYCRDAEWRRQEEANDAERKRNDERRAAEEELQKKDNIESEYSRLNIDSCIHIRNVNDCGSVILFMRFHESDVLAQERINDLKPILLAAKEKYDATLRGCEERRTKVLELRQWISQNCEEKEKCETVQYVTNEGEVKEKTVCNGYRYMCVGKDRPTDVDGSKFTDNEAESFNISIPDCSPMSIPSFIK